MITNDDLYFLEVYHIYNDNLIIKYDNMLIIKNIFYKGMNYYIRDKIEFNNEQCIRTTRISCCNVVTIIKN